MSVRIAAELLVGTAHSTDHTGPVAEREVVRNRPHQILVRVFLAAGGRQGSTDLLEAGQERSKRGSNTFGPLGITLRKADRGAPAALELDGAPVEVRCVVEEQTCGQRKGQPTGDHRSDPGAV